jgi:hypothetical protein
MVKIMHDITKLIAITKFMNATSPPLVMKLQVLIIKIGCPCMHMGENMVKYIQNVV